MGSGILFGLTAAVCWGVADFCARGSSRLGGTFLTLIYIQLVAVAALLLIALPLGLIHLGGILLGPALATAGINLAIMGGAGFLYRAFAIGKIAIASPIAASFAAVTAILALATGERPAPIQLAGIVLTLGGVVLASSVPGANEPPAAIERPLVIEAAKSIQATTTPGSRLEPGLLDALAAMLIFGVGYWAQHYVVESLGGMEVAFIAKVADLIVLGSIAVVGGLVFRLRARPTGTKVRSTARPWYAPSPPMRGFWLFVVPTALLDTSANIAYNLGITGGLVSVVVVLSSLFSAVTVLLAWIFLRERLRGWQWLGVAAIFLGIALVSV
jgi:drug/metabolite transporter (DMT)-like permease